MVEWIERMDCLGLTDVEKAKATVIIMGNDDAYRSMLFTGTDHDVALRVRVLLDHGEWYM